MTTRNVLPILIVVTMAIFSVAYVVAQMNLIAAWTLVFGVIWLILELRGIGALNGIFLLVFLAFAVLGCLNDLSAPVMLLGVSTALAAWDLSRFRARIADEAEGNANPLLEAHRLQKLTLTLIAGYLLALVPTLVSLSLTFVSLAVITLVAMLLLRRSILALRDEKS